MGGWFTMFNTTQMHWDHRGYAFLGLLCAMFLFSGIGLAAVWGLQHYLVLLSDVDLRQSMQNVTQRIAYMADRAVDVAIYPTDAGNNKVAFRSLSNEGKGEWTQYYRNGRQAFPTIVKNKATHPVTGGHILSQVGVSKMKVYRLRSGLYELEIKSWSGRSHHTHDVRTILYIPAEGARIKKGG